MKVQAKLTKVVQIAKNLSIPHVVALLKSPPEDSLSTLPPVNQEVVKCICIKQKRIQKLKERQVKFDQFWLYLKI